MKSCVCCGKDEHVSQIEKAHVKDKRVLLKEGVSNHTLNNIIDLCLSCHTNFDNHGGKTKIGIKEIKGVIYFFRLTKSNEIEKIKAKKVINVLPEYIKWKNKRVDYRLMKILRS